MQKVRSQPFSPEGEHRPSTVCRLYDFRYYFTRLTGVLFSFPSRYYFTIGHRLVFSLTSWSRQFRTGFLVSRITQVSNPPIIFLFHLQDYHLLWLIFPDHLIIKTCKATKLYFSQVKSYNPGYATHTGLHIPSLGCSPFARRYLGNHYCFIFLEILRCFNSLGFALLKLCIHFRVIRHNADWVPPFGHLRVKVCLQLTAAYRSLPRPSSPICAKPSLVNP